MLGSKRTRQTLYSALTATLLLALLLAGCTAESFQWITPIPPVGTPLPVEEVADAELASTPEAVEEAATEVVEEATSEEAVAEETAVDEATVEKSAGGTASPITHALKRREDCTSCHEPGAGDRNASPEDHVNLTDDLCVYCHMPEEGSEAIPPLPERAETEFCLPCHGPIEELQAGTADYVTEDGLAGNPHMFVPHDQTTISSCRNCHSVHELPVTAPEEIEQADIGYCFAACHHEQDFEPCDACH